MFDYCSSPQYWTVGTLIRRNFVVWNDRSQILYQYSLIIIYSLSENELSDISSQADIWIIMTITIILIAYDNNARIFLINWGSACGGRIILRKSAKKISFSWAQGHFSGEKELRILSCCLFVENKRFEKNMM